MKHLIIIFVAGLAAVLVAVKAKPSLSLSDADDEVEIAEEMDLSRDADLGNCLKLFAVQKICIHHR